MERDAPIIGSVHWNEANKDLNSEVIKVRDGKELRCMSFPGEPILGIEEVKYYFLYSSRTGPSHENQVSSADTNFAYMATVWELWVEGYLE